MERFDFAFYEETTIQLFFNHIRTIICTRLCRTIQEATDTRRLQIRAWVPKARNIYFAGVGKSVYSEVELAFLGHSEHLL